MTIVKLQGGLGNQLFQYAYGRALMERGHNVVFDTSFFSNNTNYTKRDLSLKKFKLSPEISFENIDAGMPLLKKIFYKIDNDRRVRFVNSLLKKPPRYVEGFFSSEKYFKNIRSILLKDLVLVNPSEEYKKVSLAIRNSESPLMIHARRGDYLTSSGLTILNKEYYQKALSFFSIGVTIFAFSDDPTWLQEVLGKNVYMVSGKGLSDYEELSLMSLCDNFIIANSTFSWWGAWLSKSRNKKIVAPKKWFTKKLWWRANRDVVPEDWIRV